MDIKKFVPSQKTLQSLGYTEEKIKNTYNWKKRIGKNPYPRFHVVINDNKATIHIDQNRKHGFMTRWLGMTKKKNIINNNHQLKKEIRRLEIENIYNKVLEVKKVINKKLSELNELRMKAGIKP